MGARGSAEDVDTGSCVVVVVGCSDLGVVILGRSLVVLVTATGEGCGVGGSATEMELFNTFRLAGNSLSVGCGAGGIDAITMFPGAPLGVSQNSKLSSTVSPPV